MVCFCQGSILSFLVLHQITFFPCTQFLFKQLSASSRADRIYMLLSKEKRILNPFSDIKNCLFIAKIIWTSFTSHFSPQNCFILLLLLKCPLLFLWSRLYNSVTVACLRHCRCRDEDIESNQENSDQNQIVTFYFWSRVRGCVLCYMGCSQNQ